jgi:hypothetical protein
MKFSRELLVDEVLGETFHLYRRKFLPLILPTMVAGVSTALAFLLINWFFPSPSIPSVTFPSGEIKRLDTVIREVLVFAVMAIAKGFLLFTIFWILNVFAYSVIIKYSVDALQKNNVKLSVSLTFVASKFVPIFKISFATAFLIYFGLLFLVVPGILLMIMFSLSIQVLIIEDKDVFESLKRSMELVLGRWGKTFGLLFALCLLILFVMVPVSLVTNLVFSAEVASILNSVVVALIQPIVPIAFSLWYYSMRAREKSF